MNSNERFNQVYSFFTRLRNKQSLVEIYDGSKGTSLWHMARRAGLTLTDLMNLYFPEAVLALHRDYKNAGAGLIQTNTFRANKSSFESAGIKEDVIEVNKAGAEIARQAVGDLVLVVGSMGPTGKIVSDRLAKAEVSGVISVEEATDIFEEQARGLYEGGVDIFGPETMDNPEEIIAAILGIRRVDNNAPIIATVTFSQQDRGGKKIYNTNFGLSPAKLITITY